MKTLPPVRVTTDEWDEIERQIKKAFRIYLYNPLLTLAGQEKLKNAKSDDDSLRGALNRGLITYRDGTFSGQFSSRSSHELKNLGATWDSETKSFKLKGLPDDLLAFIQLSDVAFKSKIQKVVEALGKILPEKISYYVKSAPVFKKAIKKTDKELVQTVDALKPLGDNECERIAEEWANNLDLYIKDFADHEILELRKEVADSFFKKDRSKSLVDVIHASYGVTERKAKFLARQETQLLMTKLKEVRYTKAGVNHYRWKCVAGTAKHPVRPSHKVLDNKIFRWDDPPITTAKNEPERRNNPGADYNCRCMAIPVVMKEKE